MNKTGELHLVVLWERARRKETEILADLQKDFTVLATYDISWSPESVKENFLRFTPGGYNVRECGAGRFLLVILRDTSPRYALRETPGGLEEVNVALYDRQVMYRTWVCADCGVYAALRPEQTNRDLTLLLGVNSEDYLRDAPNGWSRQHIEIERNLTGAQGWESAEQLFYVLNNTVKYLLLFAHGRSLSDLLDGSHCIELLTEYAPEVALMLNARKVHRAAGRVGYSFRLAGKKHICNLRSVGDSYFCAEWAADMLKRRSLAEHRVYVPDSEDEFYSEVYHTLVHLNQSCAELLSSSTGCQKVAQFNLQKSAESYPSETDACYAAMLEYMRKHGYTFSVPSDDTVPYNEQLKKNLDFITKISGDDSVCNITQIRLEQERANKPLFMRGDARGRDVFIKLMPNAESCVNEYRYGRLLFEACPEHVVEPVFYRSSKGVYFVAVEYVHAPTLEKVMTDVELSDEVKRLYVSQLEEIARALISKKMLHRDIRPANLLVMPDGTLKLIDFEFAVSWDSYTEMQYVKCRPGIVRSLGAECGLDYYKWDDMYSISLIMKKLGATPEMNEAASYVHSQIGKMRIVYPGRKMLRIKRSILRFLSRLVPVKSWRRIMRHKY